MENNQEIKKNLEELTLNDVPNFTPLKMIVLTMESGKNYPVRFYDKVSRYAPEDAIGYVVGTDSRELRHEDDTIPLGTSAWARSALFYEPFNVPVLYLGLPNEK